MEREWLEIVGDSFVYSNQGSAGSGAVILYEEVAITVGEQEGKRKIVLGWKYFTNYVENQKGRGGKVAVPSAVHGGGVETHETEFLARKLASGTTEQQQNVNFLSWDVFVESLKSKQELVFTFQSYIFENGDIVEFSAECRTVVAQETSDRLQLPKYARTVLTCEYEEAPSKKELAKGDVPEKLIHLKDFLKDS